MKTIVMLVSPRITPVEFLNLYCGFKAGFASPLVLQYSPDSVQIGRKECFLGD